jgi:two-component system, cell cycle response regulator
MRVLVADDELTGRMLAERWIQNWGYETVVVKDGEAALEALKKDPSIQLAVLDWMMPGLSGLEVCQSVRTSITDRYVYMVLLTGKGESGDTVMGFDAGADDYMTKPCNPRELEARLRVGKRIVELERTLVRVQEQLSHEASHDALTGLFNRRAIMEELERELLRGGRSGQPVSLILCDIDHFKSVNDNYGHPAGDEVLRSIPPLICSALRNYDRAGRYGGEEFLIVLSNCPESAALNAAERVRHAVEAKPIVISGRELTVTLSLGVASSEVLHEGVSSLVKAADRALYRAKRSGRNRAILAEATDYLATSSARRSDFLVSR